jgi:hypothetical protein
MMPLASRLALRALVSLSLLLAVASWSGRARAYAWMIRHDYTGCNQCHADPSGGGLLTEYGRAQGEVLLRSHYGGQGDASAEEEPGRLKDFLFGVVPLPESVLLGGDYRLMFLHSKVGASPASNRLIQMQADLEAQVTVDRFRANASVGYDHTGAQAAWLTSRSLDNAVSRVHWVGLDLGEDKQFLLRAGRMNLPYGVRSVEHTLFIHSPPAITGGGVRDDLSSGQQHGVALAYNGEGVRGEAMLIAGNYQVNPDAFRERGYAAYVEWAPSMHLAVGASSLMTTANRDALLGTPLIRQAHGLFARAAPWGPLTLLAEADVLAYSQPSDRVAAGQPQTRAGYAAFLQADLEVWQGLHVMLTGEATRPPVAGSSASFGAWGSVAWFFAPHADLRLDAIQQSLGLGPTPLGATSLLVQLHVYL